MALLFMDGFDHYGPGDTGRDNMLNGVWAQMSSATIDNSKARTGIRSLLTTGSGTGDGARRVLPGATKSILGWGYALWMDGLPTTPNSQTIMSVRNNINEALLSIGMDTTGRITVHQGDIDENSIFTTDEPLILTQTWNHLEAKFDISGSIELRLNGVTVINLTGITYNSSGGIAQIMLGPRFFVFGGGERPMWADDMFAWDTSGSLNNDWLGDRRVLTIFPNANDPSFADYTSTGGDGFDTIAEEDPNDDTSFIDFDPNVGDAGQFDLEDVPESLSSIAGVQTYTRMKKLESGEANIQVSLENQGSLANGVDRPITTSYAYWQDMFEINPRLGVPWTPVEFNAAKVRFTRTA